MASSDLGVLLELVVRRIEELLAVDPLAIINESELQAMLHLELCRALPEPCPLELEGGVINRRPGDKLTARRAYRELKTTSGRASREVDILLLGESLQFIQAKANGAPARFRPPYAAVIETKMDASPEDCLAGLGGRKLSRRSLAKDLSKWEDNELKAPIYSVVLTARPDWYDDIPHVLTISRPLMRHRGKARPVPAMAAVAAARDACEAALDHCLEQYRLNPLWFLREKDFETEVLAFLRDVAGAAGSSDLNPVRTQWWSQYSDELGRRRRHDVVVLAADGKSLALELELKTSHSDSHNWFRKREVRNEYSAMQRLMDAGLIERGIFVLFRYGTEKWISDALALGREHPSVELRYLCSEM